MRIQKNKPRCEQKSCLKVWAQIWKNPAQSRRAGRSFCIWPTVGTPCQRLLQPRAPQQWISDAVTSHTFPRCRPPPGCWANGPLRAMDLIVLSNCPTELNRVNKLLGECSSGTSVWNVKLRLQTRFPLEYHLFFLLKL